jgi:hypothetical protein
MINPVILIAILIQGAISKNSRMAGAVAGYLITTGIMLWGLSAYAEGDAIALFGVVLSQPAFLVACLIWYGLDTRDYVRAKRESAAIGAVSENRAPSSDLTGAGSGEPSVRMTSHPPLGDR